MRVSVEALVHVHMCWPVIHACSDHCTPPYSRPHCRQAPRIDLLTVTVQNEIKSNDQRYRSYDDSVIPCYMTTLLYRGRLFDDLGIPRYYWYYYWYSAIYDDHIALPWRTTWTTQRTHTHRHYLQVHTFWGTVMHVAVNMVGAKHRCSVVLMLCPRVIGGIGLASRGGVCPVHVFLPWSFPAPFSKSITLRVYELSLSN